MMKHKVTITLLIIAFILATVLGVNKYKENQRYESYISLHLINDISSLTTDLLQNQRIYNDILQFDIITPEQVESLHNNNYSLGKVTQDLHYLSTVLQRTEHDEIRNITANNASDIGYFFTELIWDKAEREGIDNDARVYHLPYGLPSLIEFEIEQDEKEKIEMIKELNERWLNAVANNIEDFSENQILNLNLSVDYYEKNAIKQEFWVDLIVQMEMETKEFLSENNYLDKIGTKLN